MLGDTTWGQWQFMYTAYCDDSGKESDHTQRWIVMAGYLAHEGYWRMFAPPWAHELRRYGIAALHMKDAIQRVGPYSDWSIEKRDEALTDFLRVIKTSHVIGLGIGVDASAWREHQKNLKSKDRLTAMEFCFLRLMRLVTKRMGIVEPADAVLACFDTDRDFASTRLNRWLELRARHSELRGVVTGLAFADVSMHHPLQAADVLAWITRKDLVQRTGGYELYPLYKELFVAFPEHPLEYGGELWTKAELEQHLDFSALVSSDAPPSSAPDA